MAMAMAASSPPTLLRLYHPHYHPALRCPAHGSCHLPSFLWARAAPPPRLRCCVLSSSSAVEDKDVSGSPRGGGGGRRLPMPLRGQYGRGGGRGGGGGGRGRGGRGGGGGGGRGERGGGERGERERGERERGERGGQRGKGWPDSSPWRSSKSPPNERLQRGLPSRRIGGGNQPPPFVDPSSVLSNPWSEAPNKSVIGENGEGEEEYSYKEAGSSRQLNGIDRRGRVYEEASEKGENRWGRTSNYNNNNNNNNIPARKLSKDEFLKGLGRTRGGRNGLSTRSVGSVRPPPWQQGLGRAFKEGGEDDEEEEEDEEGDEEEEEEEEEGEEVESKSFNGSGTPQKSAMARIIEKLRSIEDAEKASKGQGSINKKAKYRKGRTPGSIILPKASQDLFSITNTTTAPSPSSKPKSFHDVLDTRFPWELKDEVEFEEDEEEEEEGEDEGGEEGDEEEFGLNKADYAYGVEEDGKQRKRRGPPSLAECTISEEELKRLRGLALQMTNKIKVGRLGVTEGVVLAIHQKWRKAELVKVRCVGTTGQNMRVMHEDLEKKTGGLVVWRSGAAAVIYRGEDYDYDAIMSEYWNSSAASGEVNVEEADKGFEDDSDSEGSEISNEDNDEEISTTPPAKPRSRMPFVDIEYAMEVESILQDLGPRYEDWGGPRPVPVDGDLLPPIIPDYKPPFRFLPYGMKPKLTDFELTKIRRMSRPLPPHFAIGRNRGLQGVGVAMVKLWEKSEVAKISVKRGVQNTNNERIAEELKRLTGGVLISRDKHFITLYRGKDFLPQAVASALSERQAMASVFQEEEDKFQAGSSTISVVDVQIKPSTAGTLSESLEVKQLYERQMNSEEHQKLRVEAEKATKLEAKRKIERRLSLAVSKIERAQREQEKLERYLIPSEAPDDRETLTEEERFMFRKLGLRMKPFLLLGKRGVFDGIVENMHLHWKYRELVKIICKERDPSELKNTARMLEYESGGVLVAVELTSKGHAIIVYRGKNYQRPSQLRPKNLLTKRKALKRAQELQRQESLSKITVALQKEIDKMKADLDELSESQMEISSKASGDLNDTQDMQEEVSDTDIASLKDERELNATQDIQSEYNYSLENEDAFDRDLSGEAIENDRGGLELDAASVDGFRFNQFDGGIPSGSSKALAYHEKKSLEEEATRMCKAAHYHVGKSKDLEKLTKLIRSHFERHSLVKIGAKIKPQGMTVLEIGQLLERSTGGVLVSTTPTKIVMFRGHEERHNYSSFSQEGEKPHTPSLIETSSNIDERLEEDSGSLVNHEDLAELINGEQCDFLVSSFSVEEVLDSEEIYTSGKLKDGDQSGEEDARGQLESSSESFVNADIV